MGNRMNYSAKLAVHIALVFMAFVLAYTLRRGLLPEWWLTNPDALPVLSWAVIYAVMAGGYELLFRVERGAWRFSSARDVVRLAQSTGLTALTFLALIFITNRAITLPRSTLLLSWLTSLFALVGIRLAWRLAFDRSLSGLLLPVWGRGGASIKRALVLVGDVNAAQIYLRRHSAGDDREYAPTSILAKTATFTGQQVLGVAVVGTADQLEDHIEAVSKDRGATGAILFLDEPIKGLGLTAEQIGRVRAQGWRLLRQPSVTELRHGARLQEMKLEEFLPREPISINSAPIEGLISGRRVLVTGAGGSIGSEICRQLVAFGCSHITLVDHSEYLLFEIDRELSAIRTAPTRSARLCNVRDGERLQQVFVEEKPELVFHAAALKHVTLVENNPSEGVLTNVLGTLNVVNAARAVDVNQMVLISTDKAVAPSNVMGATKRLAEAVVCSSMHRERSCIVRFGNVLGSAGSVIPIFKDQIERGGPVTVTDLEVERYFMTIPEAVELVLHSTAICAACDNAGPRKFILEMGRPVKIVELARRMIELSGLAPDVDIAIEVTGLRPGEKITEELVDFNETATPCMVGIKEIDGGDGSMSPEQIERLRKAALTGEAEAVRKAVFKCIAGIRSGGQIAEGATASL